MGTECLVKEVSMSIDVEKERLSAVQRLLHGESPESIYRTLDRSRSWLYKWLSRFSAEEASWFQSHSKRPLNSPRRTSTEIEQIVKLVRLSLYNQGLFCGAQAIRWEMEEMWIRPLLSLSTIERILRRHDLTHRRTGRYEPKGKAYPALPALQPNQTHQADLVGPRYLKGPVRFYSLNVVDL
jgi:transposase InsO family protein